MPRNPIANLVKNFTRATSKTMVESCLAAVGYVWRVRPQMGLVELLWLALFPVNLSHLSSPSREMTFITQLTSAPCFPLRPGVAASAHTDSDLSAGEVTPQKSMRRIRDCSQLTQNKGAGSCPLSCWGLMLSSLLHWRSRMNLDFLAFNICELCNIKNLPK